MRCCPFWLSLHRYDPPHINRHVIMLSVHLCRELDEGLVAAETSSAEGLALHEAVVSLAIGCGGWLIHQIRTNGADISGHTVETLDASLELLVIFHCSRHPNFSADDIEAARRRIFNAAI